MKKATFIIEVLYQDEKEIEKLSNNIERQLLVNARSFSMKDDMSDKDEYDKSVIPGKWNKLVTNA